MSLFQKEGRSAWRTVGYVVFLLIFVVLALFAWRTFGYYRAIKSGKSNPLIDTYAGLSLTSAIANSSVSAADLARLAPPTSPTFGAPSSTLTIVEFLDFGCPFCEASYGAVREISQKYQDRVRIVYRDFPVVELHPRAFQAALAARCAHEQGKYLPYHDKLFANQTRHEDEDLFRYAKEVGADEPRFKTCYESQKYASVIQTDTQDGLNAGVQGTPTFFFNGVPVPGMINAELMELFIQRFLDGS